MEWLLPVTKCAPWLINGRPCLKLMLMSRLPVSIHFIYFVLVLLITIIILGRPIMLRINKFTKSGRRWRNSWPKRCKRLKRGRQLIWDSIGKVRRDLTIYLSSPWCLCYKVKFWRSPSLDCENSWSFMIKAEVLEKLLGMSPVLKLIQLIDVSSPSKNLFKIQTFNVTNKKSYSLFFKKKSSRLPLLHHCPPRLTHIHCALYLYSSSAPWQHVLPPGNTFAL